MRLGPHHPFPGPSSSNEARITPAYPRIGGLRLGIYVLKDAEIIEYASPYGVFSVARRFEAYD